MSNYQNAMTPEDVPGGEIEQMPSREDIITCEVTEAVVGLLNAAVRLEHPSVAVCHMCHTVETHAAHCAIPTLEAWLARQ